MTLGLMASRSAAPATRDVEPVRSAVPAPAGDGAPRRVSVIISNRNYGRYLGQSITSALNLDWPDVEVIVIDNGSTDDSRAVIESFGDRLRTVFQEDRGNLEACNTGVAMSTGEAIFFLDADDVVEPQMMREVAAAWSPRVSKVQFQTRIIDGDGQPTGSFFPQYLVVPTPAEILEMARTIGNYAGPHGPGNIYARRYLERIFPLEPVAGPFSDSCCIAAAPFFGDVAVVPKPLVRYRVHGANDYAMLTLDRQRFARMLERAIQLFEYSRRIAASTGIEVEPDAIDRSLHTLAFRVACFRLTPQLHPYPHDSRRHLAMLLMGALRHPQGMGQLQAVAVVAWGLVTVAAPKAWAEKLISWRFALMTRPPIMKRLLGSAGILKSR
jgi:glycosyltransferase involved in cell wall biosynthesis